MRGVRSSAMQFLILKGIGLGVLGFIDNAPLGKVSWYQSVRYQVGPEDLKAADSLQIYPMATRH
jgi:hypothetical protein